MGSSGDLEQAFRDNAALELVLHGYKQRWNEFRAWFFWDNTADECDGLHCLHVFDYGMVSFGQRINGRMVWFPVSDEAIEQLILETVKGWEK